MICQNCGKNEANVRYTQIINGSKKEMILCEECAEKLGINNFKMNMPIHFSNFLDDIFDDEQLLPDFIREKSNKCDSCGELYDDFIKTGLLGCAECYDMFDDRLEPVLKHIQGNVKHVGRKPLNLAEKLENVGENSTRKTSNEAKAGDKNENSNKQRNGTKATNKADDKDQITRTSKNDQEEIYSLKEDLNRAIQEERYEDAAIIRDKIKKMTDNK